MTQKTSISWTDLSSNLIRAVHQDTGKRGWGCVKVSEGCKNCYSEAMNKRFGTGLPFNVQSLDKIDFIFDEKEAQKIGKKKNWGKKIFVCDMTDLFGDFVPDELIVRVFETMFFRGVMSTFQVLTKRPERMLEFMNRFEIDDYGPPLMTFEPEGLARYFCSPDQWPLSNVWLGTSVENQKQTERIKYLIQTPAKIRFLSIEPLLEPVNFTDNPWWDWRYTYDFYPEGFVSKPIDWVIVGGESGRNARRCEIEWIRDIVQQCKEAGIACFVKQLGSYQAKQLGLKDFKGSDSSEWPSDLRVQNFPK